MRQLMNVKKTARIAARTGLPIHCILVRGNTGHRKDLCLNDGAVFCMWPDGEITRTEGDRWGPLPLRLTLNRDA